MPAKRPRKPSKKPPQAKQEAAKIEWATTAIHVPKTTLELLKAVAFHRAQTQGGRISVSKLLTEIVESSRKELEQEIRS